MGKQSLTCQVVDLELGYPSLPVLEDRDTEHASPPVLVLQGSDMVLLLGTAQADPAGTIIQYWDRVAVCVS